MNEIVMPRLSDTMEEGTILRWLKADGDQIARGEELVEIETDKATMIYESDQAGRLTLIAAEGDTLPVGEPIASVQDDKNDDERGIGVRVSSPDRTGTAEPVSSSGGTATEGTSSAPAQAATSESSAPVTQQPVEAETSTSTERIKASPLAKRLASERGVELSTLTGSGPGGRIVKADVEADQGADPGTQPTGTSGAPAAEAANTPSASAATSTEQAGTPAVPDSASVATAKGETTDVELTRTQQTVARRMAESKATIPDFTLLVEVDMEDCVALRGELKRIGQQGEEATPTYNDMVVKACALALREFPQANGSYRDGRMQLHSRINIGVAVAAEGTLIVPTVFDAEEKSLGEIARETRALAGRVRDGSITPPELGGGTFTVSNLGMFGVRSFTAIVNPPQAAIVSVGSLEQRAVVREGEVVARHTMSLTLVCDHRILYGAEAAEFLARARELLQNPVALTL
jgi:pyruvate dehydrogenase E2 component (dihydrolipoamide acetyltransferase)